VNYLLAKSTSDIIAVILLAPTDMAGWAATDPNHKSNLAKAKELMTQGQGEELVSAQCWQDKTPISAQTYLSICEAGTAVDIYGDREDGALLSRIDVPTLIPYGDEDIGITEIDGSMDKWLERVDKIKALNTQIAVMKGAAHSYQNHEEALANTIDDFLKSLH
jgi:pimeloyl-ACP methyl ester carboxylesterase